MAWRRPGDKPLSEPIMVSLLTHICITRPQWVKQHILDYKSEQPTAGCIAVFHKDCCYTKHGGIIANLTLKSLGVYYWCVKIPQRGYTEHGLEYIMFYVQKHIASMGAWSPNELQTPYLKIGYQDSSSSNFHQVTCPFVSGDISSPAETQWKTTLNLRGVFLCTCRHFYGHVVFVVILNSENICQMGNFQTTHFLTRFWYVRYLVFV